VHRLARIGVWHWEVATDTVTWTEELYLMAGRDPALPAPTYAEHAGLFTAEGWGRLKAAVEESLETGASYDLELELIRPDGTSRWVNTVGGVGRDDRGAVTDLYGTLRDVTESRRAADEIRRLNEELQERVVSREEQLDAATHELESLAYAVAHDVRAPLRTIDGFSALVLEDERDHLSPGAVEELGRVRRATQTLARLLDELTGLSDVSRRELVRQTVDLSALAAEEGAEAAAAEPSRTVELAVRPGLVAEADPALLRLILRELLGNAWKFTRRREQAHVEVGALDADGERAFYVRDDGVGLDMKYAQHLFGVFQRMHTSEDYEGDGVGLATVQRLVRRHGGRVWAESTVDQGATFFFTLSWSG
jgi:light-regulated signal transduction histidine kinase (bacteriophytochrome)